MVDTFSKAKRSEIMAANRGRGNLSTEQRLCEVLTEAGILGWRTNAKEMVGKPDLVFDDEKLAVFADGCFWHGCNKCRSIPKTNSEYWGAKIAANVARDKRVSRYLRRCGWHIIRVWEHDLKRRPEVVIRRIMRKLNEISLLERTFNS